MCSLILRKGQNRIELEFLHDVARHFHEKLHDVLAYYDPPAAFSMQLASIIRVERSNQSHIMPSESSFFNAQTSCLRMQLCMHIPFSTFLYFFIRRRRHFPACLALRMWQRRRARHESATIPLPLPAAVSGCPPNMRRCSGDLVVRAT